MIKMLYLNILLADSTENQNTFVLDNYKRSKKFKQSALRLAENITRSVRNFVKCMYVAKRSTVITQMRCTFVFTYAKKKVFFVQKNRFSHGAVSICLSMEHATNRWSDKANSEDKDYAGGNNVSVFPVKLLK